MITKTSHLTFTDLPINPPEDGHFYDLECGHVVWSAPFSDGRYDYGFCPDCSRMTCKDFLHDYGDRCRQCDQKYEMRRKSCQMN